MPIEPQYTSEDLTDLDQIRDVAEAAPQNTGGAELHVKTFSLHVKEVDEQEGTFTGYASTYQLDSDQELMLPGAFDRSLKLNPHPLVLADHDVKRPIGINISAQPDNFGLKVTAKLALGNTDARNKYEVMRLVQSVGGKMGLSVGFRAIEKKWVKGKNLPGKQANVEPEREYLCFSQVHLLEYSVVSFQAAPEAWVGEVKSQFDKQPSLEAESQILTKQELMTDFDSALSERQRQRELARHKSDIDSALYDTLSAIHGGDSDMETKKSMINDCYMKHAKATADWHVATFLSGATKSFNVDLYRKSLGLTNDAPALEEEQVVKTKAAPEPGEEENRAAEEWMFKGGLVDIDTKSGKHKLSAAAKAQLAHALDMHKSAMDLTARGCQIVKDMFGDDSTPQVDGSGSEMGAMSDQQPIDAKSEEQREEKDTEDLSNFAKQLESLTKSRIAAL